MKIEKYYVEIEMPDGDSASHTWVKDALQTEADVEDEGRWKVSVNKQYLEEGLIDIGKACEWLNEHTVLSEKWIIEDFRKVMMEE